MILWWKCGLSVLAVILFMMTACGRKPMLLYVDGTAVEEEEMLLLKQDTDYAVRAKLVQKWVEEDGLAEPFSYRELMKQLEQENMRRADEKAFGGTIYGMSEYSPAQYYYMTMGNYERLLKNELMKQADEETLLHYYQANKEAYRQIGRVEAVLTVREDGRVTVEKEIWVDQYNIRSASEKDEELISYLLSLSEGESHIWKDEYGRDCELVCKKKTEDHYAPYDEVSGAVLEQYAAWKLEQELNQRIAKSSVRDMRLHAERRSNEG